MFEHKHITIFGGPGSIGTLITEKILNLTKLPTKITLFCNNENELWEAKNHFDLTSSLEPAHNFLNFKFGDIRDKESVHKAIEWSSIVFNCAAMKHVGFCEEAPFEAVKTNLIGLQNILECLEMAPVELFVHISTDKAVEPVSVMGATKLIGERMVQKHRRTKTAIIRFGNVMGSRGSLVPQLEKTLNSGKKTINVSHPDMKRYFLTRKQVGDFIMKVCKHAYDGPGGNIYIPKMSEISIMDLIKETCSEFGVIDPIFNYYGYGNYEKLSEALISQSEVNLVREFKDMYIVEGLQM